MRLDETDVGRGDARPRVGPFQGPPLALGARGGQAEGPAVAGGSHRLDHGVHPVAVAFGVRQPLQYDGADALPQGDPVGGGVEGPAAAAGGQGADGGEHQVVVDAVVHVGATAQHHVAVPVAQLAAGEVEGGEGGGAGGVDGAVRAAQVEAVGDPAGDDVGEDPGKGVLGESRQLLVQGGGQVPQVGRVQGAQPVGAGQFGAGLRPEDDRCPGAVEGAVLAVAGVAEGPCGDLQGEQLHGFDRGEGGGRNAVGERVEGHRAEEAAPAGGRALPGPGRIGVVVERRVPAFGRHLGDRVRPGEDHRPVGGEVRCARVGAGHAHDRDVERVRVRPRPPVGRQFPGPPLQPRGRPLGDLAVQRRDRGRPRPQGRRLAEHEQPVHRLPFLGDALRCATAGGPPQALARDPQPAQVEPLQLLPHLARFDAAVREPPPGRLEGRGVRGGRAAGGVPGRGVQQHGVRALHRCPLEARQHRAGRHGLLREQVGGAHQHPDPGAPRGQRSRGRHRHRGGPLVVDPAREQHVEGGRVGAGTQQQLDLFLPEGERGTRSDVPAALQALEDEPPCAFGEVPLQQPR